MCVRAEGNGNIREVNRAIYTVYITHNPSALASSCLTGFWFELG